jgi:hypothetical protein
MSTSTMLESAWEAVATTALLGTDRQPLSLPPVEGALGTLLAQIDPNPPEPALLNTAALLAIYRRVGRLPAQRTSAVASAPVDDQPCCSAQATLHLVALLDGIHSAVLPEWLALAAGQQLRVSEEILPALLDHGAQHASQRKAIRRVIGVRGRWLASLNPAWSYAADTTNTIDDHWQTGLPDTRLALLHDLRQSDPARALALIASTWATEPPSLRAKFLAALAINLSLADEPFLEAALDDRRKEVRDEASQLLARLPASRLVQRLFKHVTPLLRLTGLLLKRIEVTLPEAHTPELLRDGIQPVPSGFQTRLGPRAWWLYQMLAVVPTGHWVIHWKLPPQRLVEAAARSEWHEPLLDAWLEAASRHAESDFLIALADQSIADNPARLARIAEFLPPAHLELQIQRLLTRPPAGLRGGDPELTLLTAHRRPWGAALSSTFVDQLKRIVQQPFRHADHAGLIALLPQCALLIAPASVRTLEAELPTNREDWNFWERPINQFLTLVQFRAAMHKALQAGPER